MLSCFDLKPGVTIDQFRNCLGEFTAHLKRAGLIDSQGPIGRRQSDTIMDTDEERDHEYFIISFRDRAQCDRAAEHLRPGEAAADSGHRAVFSKVNRPVFICWEDV